jgi:hypothetical protein
VQVLHCHQVDRRLFVFAVVSSASLSDIKPDSYVGVAAKPVSGGTLQAIEVHIFPPSMRGTGEGTRNWDLGAGSSMTNGSVAKVDNVGESKLTVSYRGGEKRSLSRHRRRSSRSLPTTGMSSSPAPKRSSQFPAADRMVCRPLA